MKHTACYIKDYPRPQFVRENWESLNGKWKFAFDDDNIGESKLWQKGIETNLNIIVPFSYNTKLSEINDVRRHDWIWYERQINIDSNKILTQQLILNFEGSDYVTKVWVDGSFIGEHTGGYNRFSFDITQAVKNCKDGQAKIIVKCEDSYDATQPRGKQKWMDNEFGCWYNETNGIWKTVWLEYISASHIKGVKMTPNKDTYAIDLEVEIADANPGDAFIAEVSWNGNIIAQHESKIKRDKFSCSIDIENDFEPFKVQWWNYDNAALYDIKFYLKRSQEVLDEIGSYFGFRIFTTNRDTLILNNGPTYLKMALEQGYFRNSGMTFLDENAIIDELTLIKEFGFNGVRVHQKIEDERFFYYADIMGIATWVEMPSAYEFRDATIQKVSSEWVQTVRQFYNHPSVFAWVPFNESWGVPRIMTNKREQWFTEALYYITKAYDEMRPVIANDGWEHTTTDIITLHNYCQDAEKFDIFYKDIDKVLAGENFVDYSQWRLPFANGYSYNGQPIMITEFAGIGYEKNSNDKGWGYGSKVSSDEDFTNRLAALVLAVRQNHRISGFCITQITDVGTEINGLCDADRKPKANKELLTKAIKQ